MEERDDIHPHTYYTQRGFLMFDDFATDYGHRLEIQESSAAMEPCVWLRIRPSNIPNVDFTDTVHMTVGQAIRARDALDRFIQSTEDGSKFPTDRP